MINNTLAQFAGTAGFIVIGLIILILVVLVVVIGNFGLIWLRAKSSGATVGFIELITLRIQRVPVALVVDSRINAVNSGIPVTTDELAAHHRAGGHVDWVTKSLINARKANIDLVFDQACAIDLATKGTSKNVVEAVHTSVNPQVIDCPPAGGSKRSIDAVAKDGIVIKARARVTVRTNLANFVGGATEDTIIARVGEGIVSSIGSEQSYKDVLENPDRISKNVLAKGLDSNTAFEILSIDIADVDVGENVGAKLQAEQAESNKLVAQAQAEVRRAAAVAQEQEMTARVAEMQAKVVEAEAQVPLAMAEAFRSGNLGIMDYYRMKNLAADTDMRSKIAGSDESSGSGKPKT
jgi:uncharacterized protein YqfA (UPF0365 family)